ncbi:tetraspanin-9-like isoform X2 [Lytechinus variegatus]|uniref:tetraspanin-9-like isoform X1 n=1 Tax=Lytechinus variegatus TaxID=7654 RepID=UPI001BB254DA|nr:tetraspanin-9-like isoform X1 [Lytechinus variegatus]XP_041472450.1 tetraspanin-9-like isoform X1 [Lytechinus variegatus]XP_041472451.1 tetraspanin-9-like isoform X1 [Lytechinus variegatus]XP_041472453.1 tetraspanin-9-like isoform X2 [Lytechinus variegatus]
MALEGCARIVKILMFIFNFIFFVAGIVVLAVGIYVNVVDGDFAQILPSLPYLSAGNLLIACGVIVLVVGFLGCCGAIKESPCMLLIFFFLLLLILILEIAAGALAFTYRNKVEEFVIKDLTTGLSQYNKSQSLTKAWDILQSDLQCCGVNTSDDWQSPNITLAGPFPDSCCKDGFEKDCAIRAGAVPWDVGCQGKLTMKLRDNIYIVGAIGIAFGLIQVLGLVFSMCLYCSIRDGTKA